MYEKISSGLFKNVINKMCLEILYSIYMYKKDLALNDLQLLIRHKSNPKPNETCDIVVREDELQSSYLVQYCFTRRSLV